MDAGKFWLSLWLGLALCVVAIVGVANHYAVEETKTYIENGYTKQQIKGARGSHWVKN